MVYIKQEEYKVLRTGAAVSMRPRATESRAFQSTSRHTDTCLQPEYRERDRDHARGSRDRSRSPVDRERSYRDRDDRDRSNGAYNDRNTTRTDGAMDDRQQNSQQDRRVYVGNLAYDVKWHHLKDFMREGTQLPSLRTSQAQITDKFRSWQRHLRRRSGASERNEQGKLRIRLVFCRQTPSLQYFWEMARLT